MRHAVILLAAVGAASGADAKGVEIVRKSSALDFSYAWPAEAAAIPALNRWMQTDADKIFQREARAAREEFQMSKSSNYPFHKHEIQMAWTTAGQSTRLLSLDGSFYGFTGGAHGLGSSAALLWDRARNVRIEIQALLLAGQSWTGAIRQSFCVLLDRERASRREQPIKPGEMFTECPAYKELTVLIADKNSNKLFDHVQVTADPYVAGPYVEGPYVIDLPITAAMIGRLKPEYRQSFEAQRPVQ